MRFFRAIKRFTIEKIAYGRALGVAFAYKTILCYSALLIVAAKIKFLRKFSPAKKAAVKNCIEKNNGAAIRALASEKSFILNAGNNTYKVPSTTDQRLQ